MQKNSAVSLIEMVMSIASAIDLFSPSVANHHKRVAYIAVALGREMGLGHEARHDLLLAALLHDLGALSLEERVLANSAWEANDHDTHAEAAYLLLGRFRHLDRAAHIIRHHHTPWSQGRAEASIPIESHILYLADRIDSLVQAGQPILGQATGIASTIAHKAGSYFMPELTEVFSELAWKESFWLEMLEPNLERELLEEGHAVRVELDWDDLQDFAEIIAQLIDFRSRFTAAHSSGVAAVAAILASLVGFSESECVNMKVAGYLHDVGKLAIPREILEKPLRLSEQEFQTIKSHAYYTHRILTSVRGLEDIAAWASLHHERLDGQGYPFRMPGNMIPLGARIMAVADIFTALSEERPYRNRATRDELMWELTRLVRLHQIDGGIATVLMDNYEAINRHRDMAQSDAVNAYDRFLSALQRRQMVA